MMAPPAASRNHSRFTALFLPHPDHLRKFEEIHPGAAKIILDLCVSQTEHRHRIETIQVSEGNKNARWGIVAQIVEAGFALTATAITSLYTPAWVPVTMLGMTLATFVIIYIYGKSTQKRERQRQREAEIRARPSTQLRGGKIDSRG
ncbi:MAG: DUF2335 domain-containing protein [Planctomycetaceae bacterium]|nr:DUF2335 domain-containing protein [Planctomycetaceae bacterium]